MRQLAASLTVHWFDNKKLRSAKVTCLINRTGSIRYVFEFCSNNYPSTHLFIKDNIILV